MKKKPINRFNSTPSWAHNSIRPLVASLFPTNSIGCSLEASRKLVMCSLINLTESGSFFDHWGRCGEVLFCEPYMTKEQAEKHATYFAQILGCEWRFGDSTWNPPRTVRIEFFRRDQQ